MEVYQGVSCYKGFCRLVGVVGEGERCDCLTGCVAEGEKENFSCLNNFCKNY